VGVGHLPPRLRGKALNHLEEQGKDWYYQEYSPEIVEEISKGCSPAGPVSPPTGHQCGGHRTHIASQGHCHGSGYRQEVLLHQANHQSSYRTAGLNQDGEEYTKKHSIPGGIGEIKQGAAHMG
jgi:hypothetical protein